MGKHLGRAELDAIAEWKGAGATTAQSVYEQGGGHILTSRL